MLDDNHFHAIANATLMHFNDQLEQAYDQEDLEELDYDEGSGILIISTPKGHTFMLNKHAPMRQLWLSSPIHGGLHFDYDAASQNWVLPTGGKLKEILAEGLSKTAGLSVVL